MGPMGGMGCKPPTQIKGVLWVGGGVSTLNWDLILQGDPPSNPPDPKMGPMGGGVSTPNWDPDPTG